MKKKIIPCFVSMEMVAIVDFMALNNVHVTVYSNFNGKLTQIQMKKWTPLFFSFDE